MGLVMLRGVINHELASHVTMEAIVAMLVFMGVGFMAGWIADYLIRDAMENSFRARIRWYQGEMIEAGYVESEQPTDQSQKDLELVTR